MFVLRLTVFALLLMIGSVQSWAEDNYPSKPVQLIVGMPPGGANDIFARLIGEQLTKILGQQFVVENRAGANSIIATDLVSKAPPDGYTLMLVINSHVTNAPLYQNLTYDPITSFAPVALIARAPFILMAHPSVPINSMADLIALSQEKKVTVGSPGMGSIQHLATELLTSKSPLKMTHVPYKGGAPMITDLIGGHIDVGFVTTAAGLPYVNSGKAKAIAVSSSKRSNGAPNVPTIDEAGVRGYQADVSFGIIAPAKTPDAIVRKLNTTIRAIMARPDIQKRLVPLDAQAIDASPEEFGDLMHAELSQWSALIKERGIKVEQ